MAARIWSPAFALLLAAGSLSAAESVLPQGYPPERYQHLWTKSPFTVASVIAPEAVDNTTFADTLSLAGLMIVDNQPLVTVVANDSQETQLVEANKPNASGLQVVSFVNNLDPSKVEVVLKKGDAIGKLHFNINEVAAAAPPQPGVPNQPNQANQPRRIIQPRPNSVPVPTPTQARVISRTGAPVMQQPPGAQIIRRRQLQLPGANNSNPNNRGNNLPPP